MKFLLNRASDLKDLGVIEVNSLNELKQLNGKYNGKEDQAWTNSHSIVIDFNISEEEEEQGIDGTITIYDYYIDYEC